MVLTGYAKACFDAEDYHPEKMDELVPPHLHDGLARYIEHGICPGSGMTAILCNDLRGAVGRLDVNAMAGLRGTIIFLTNFVPAPAWGSAENVKSWTAQGGLIGRARRRAGDTTEEAAS